MPEHPTLGEFLARNRDSHKPMVVPELRALITTSTATQVIHDDVLTPPVRQRATRMRDVIPSAPGQTFVPYVRELNVVDNEGGASAVAEASAKPETTMQFEGGEMRAGKVACWVPSTNEGWNDPVGLEQYVRTRLAVLVDVREDAQIINGSGLPGYTGILQVSGIQTQGAAASKAKTITAALRKVEAKEARATAVAINPSDYWDIFDVDAQFWDRLGVSAVRTRAITANTALVGDFVSGTVLRDVTQGVEVRVTESHDDYFVKNTLVIAGERRGMLITRAPELFVNVTALA